MPPTRGTRLTSVNPSLAMFILTANSIRAADSLSVGIYTIGLLAMLGFSAAYNLWPISRTK